MLMNLTVTIHKEKGSLPPSQLPIGRKQVVKASQLRAWPLFIEKETSQA